MSLFPQIDQRMFFQGLPMNPPFVPNVQLRSRMQNQLRMITGFALLTLQQHANSNDLRKNLYMTMAAGNFQNQKFYDFVASIADYAEFLIVQEGKAPNDALQTAADHLASVAACDEARLHHGIMQSLSPEARAMFDDWMKFMTGLAQTLQQFQFHNPDLQQQQQWGQPPQQQVDAWGRPVQAFATNQPGTFVQGAFQQQVQPQGQWNNPWNQQPQQQQFDQWGRPVMAAPMVQQPQIVGYDLQGRPIYAQPQMQTGGFNPNLQAQVPRQTQTQWQAPQRQVAAFNPQGQQQVSDSGKGAFGRRNFTQHQQNDESNPLVEEVTIAPDSSLNQRTQYRETVPTIRPSDYGYSDRFVSTQEPMATSRDTPAEFEIAPPEPKIVRVMTLEELINSGLSVSKNPRFPYPAAYDSSRWVAYYIEYDDGRVVEQLKEQEQQNVEDYADHETEYFFRAVSSLDRDRESNREKAVTEFNKVLAAKDVQAILDSHESDKPELAMELGIDDAVVIRPMLLDHVGVSPRTVLSTFLNSADGGVLKSTCTPGRTVVFTAGHVDPLSFDLGGAILAEEAGRSTDMKQLSDRIRVMYGRIDEAQWKRIHKRVTDHVNEILHIRMGMPKVSITSVIDDMDDLIAYLREKHGEAILRLFMDAAVSVARSNLYIFNDGGEGLASNAHCPNDPFTVMGCETETVAMIQAHSRDITLKLKGEFGHVQPSYYPELHKAMLSLLDNSPAHVRHVKIVTIDGEEIFIHRGLMSRDTVLISRGVK